MEDAEVVAAVVAGDPAGLFEALDKYAVTLYGYCRALLAQGALPPADAGEAVLDTFLIAAAKIEVLADPGMLGAWLRAVARNECHRRLLDVGMNPHEADAASQATRAPAARYLPDGMRGRILTACADDTPAGRARRVSVTHRAAPFGRDGFPKAVSRAQPPAWRRVPVIAAAVSTLMVVAAGGLALAVSGGHPAQAAGPALGYASTGEPDASQPGEATGAAAQPSFTAVARLQRTPGAPPSSSAAPQPSHPASSSPARTAPSASPSASVPASPSRTAGVLIVSPATIVVSSVKGHMGRAAFTITASGGPVDFSITIAGGGAISVFPAAGHLKAGEQQTIVVIASSRASYTSTLVLSPNGSVTVQVTARL